MMRSLFLKIFLWFWATTVLVMLAIFITGSMQREVQVNRWRASMDETLPVYAQVAAQEFDHSGLNGINGYLERLERDSSIHAALLEPSGMNVSGRSSRVPKELVDAAMQSGKAAFLAAGPNDFGAQRTVGPSGRPYVFVVRMSRLDEKSYTRTRSEIVWGLLAIAISGLICYLLTRYLTRPVLQLRSAARSLAAGDLSARAGPAVRARRDEIGELVRDFDSMAERIEELVNSQRQLISDISHELRSPLARLNVALGLARQRAGADASLPLDRIEREAERLNELIGKLLSLARMQAASSPPEVAPVDLRELLNEIVVDAQFEAQEHQCSVRMTETRVLPLGVQLSTEPPECQVMGSVELLRSAVENVVRNAVRYTEPGTPVEIALIVRGAAAAIVVRDHGPGVPEAELESLFQPFYRVAGARERQTGGTGLGLAIAERAVRLHRGSIKAENAPDGTGLRVEIRLPLTTGVDVEKTVSRSTSPVSR